MRKRYYMNIRGLNAKVIVGWLILLAIFAAAPLVTSGSSVEMIIGIVIVAIFVGFIWLGITRGTYITIDDNKNLYNTFFFIKRNVIPLSSIVSLNVRHPALLLGRATEVWKTYRDKDGRIVSKSFVTRETMKRNDFKKLLEEIRQENPNIAISEELLK